MALASPHVRSFSIEAQEFPDLASYYAVSAVPKIVVNDRVEFLGALPEPSFLQAVLSALPAAAGGSGTDGAGEEGEGAVGGGSAAGATS
jgi:Thioredoxin domain